MAIVVLHLSDIHIRSKKDWILDKSQQIARCTYASLHDATAVFIVVSGDVAYSGKADEYEAARSFLSNIKSEISSEREIPVHFVIAPGNHDCDFDLNNKTRQLTLSSVRAKPEEIDDSVIETGCAVQKPYFDFVDCLSATEETRLGDQLWTSHRYTVEGREVIFEALNVSWCSQIREDYGSIVFPHERYAHLVETSADIRISVLHHPLNWFSQAVYHPFKQMLRGLSNVIISGHEHVGGVGEDFNADSGHSAYIEGCVLQEEKNLALSSFNIAELNVSDGTYRTTRYLWNQGEKHYQPTEEGSWSDFRSLPKKSTNIFALSNEFQQLITDPGAAFQTLKGSAIKLADLYVFPDMQEPVEKSELKQFLSTSLLLDPSRIDNGVLLSGEEKVGATSLLYMLFGHYHDTGFVPLYLRGPDIKSHADRDVDAAIQKAVIEQYGAALLEKYKQLPSSKKMLLLDDFDDGPVKACAFRGKLLTAISARYSRFVVTVGELFDFKETLSPSAGGKLAEIKEYRVLPFGFTLRAHLVRRWFQRTADDGSLDESALLARCDQAERLLDAVRGRNIVPALPLYLLTILQSVDAGLSGGFEESGLGEYYDFLIKEGFKAAAIPKKEWGKVVEFCSHLAWLMHATEHKEVSHAELRAFTEKFSKAQHEVAFDRRIADLLEARVLSKSGDYYRFRYHYIYYFLKGRYLASKLDTDIAIQAYIKECCAHLYVRENANTILFLAHHSFEKPIFIESVVEALNRPFGAIAPIEFKRSDTGGIADFVRDLPALKYSGELPETVREKENHRKDAMGPDEDGLTDAKQDGAESDFLPQLVALFKTVEILGQILKNQIANVDRAKRIELLEQLLKGPLRAVRAFFELFMTDKEMAQRELAELLAKNKVGDDDNKRLEIARRLLAELVQFSVFGFIAKAVSSISADDLTEDIETAAKNIGSPAANLIAAGVRLDSPKDLPRKVISKLLDEVKTDFVAMRVLQMLTLQRLYMFRTSEQDKQWLDSQKILGLQMQHAVEMNTRGKKAIPSSKH